jgi:hypothetical protein
MKHDKEMNKARKINKNEKDPRSKPSVTQNILSEHHSIFCRTKNTRRCFVFFSHQIISITTQK